MNRPVYWPDETQELMLRACLLRGEAALSAWREWLPKVDIDNLDNGSNRLLPLLYHNLKREKLEHPVMERLKGIYRFYWSQNQLLFHQVGAPILKELQQRGIKTMLVKGTALVSRHYLDPGLRPMGDFDFLVQVKDAAVAIECAKKLGWIIESQGSTELALAQNHAAYFHNARLQHLDLHWHMLIECQYPGADDDFWAAAVPTKIAGVETLSPCPTDLLLHICVHGAVLSEMLPIRWVPDAMFILNTSEIDWSRLVAQARKRQFVLPLRSTLKYLKTAFKAPVPKDILETLEKSETTLLERLEHRYKTTPRTFMGGLPEHLFSHWRQQRDASLPGKIFKLPGFLQRRWKLESQWKLPFFMVGKFWRLLRS